MDRRAWLATVHRVAESDLVCVCVCVHTHTHTEFKVSQWEEFPGSSMVKNLSSNTGDTGLIPGGRTKIPHAVGQRSLCSATKEPMHCSY